MFTSHKCKLIFECENCVNTQCRCTQQLTNMQEELRVEKETNIDLQRKVSTIEGLYQQLLHKAVKNEDRTFAITHTTHTPSHMRVFQFHTYLKEVTTQYPLIGCLY
jgi:hypothetical protein